MTLFKAVTVAAFLAGTLTVAAAPASAVATTFAQFGGIGTKGQTYFKNDGTNGANGTGGSIYTTNTPTSTTPGSRMVTFSFLQPSLASAGGTGLVADFTLLGTVTNTPALLAGNQLIQTKIDGTFSFTNHDAITILGVTYAAGTKNLLSGTFKNAAIVGQRLGNSGSFGGSGDQALGYSFTSDFLTFTPTADLDFSISLTSITSALQSIPTSGLIPNRALRTFRAFSGGSFSSDPSPSVDGVPEPAVWGMMIVGFGMVGFQARRGNRKGSVGA